MTTKKRGRPYKYPGGGRQGFNVSLSPAEMAELESTAKAEGIRRNMVVQRSLRLYERLRDLLA